MNTPSNDSHRKKKWTEFGLQTLSSTIGTVVGIILTIGTSLFLNHQEEKSMERTSTLMVLHNIDEFCSLIESHIKWLQDIDSLNMLVIKHYPNHLDKLPDSTLKAFSNSMKYRRLSVTDHSAETIFSTNIEIWKNIKDAKFLNNIGICFSMKEAIEKEMNELDAEMKKNEESYIRIKHNLDKEKSPATLAKALIDDPIIYNYIYQVHNISNQTLVKMVEFLRLENERNMKRMQISVKDFDIFLE